MLIEKQLSVLIQLAKIDNELAEKELKLIEQIGRANGLSDEEIVELINKPLDDGGMETLSDDEKFEYLYNVIQLMKIDRQVFKSEIVFCQKLATKLGFKEGVVAALSTKIYSDPTITANREELKKQALRYLTVSNRGMDV